MGKTRALLVGEKGRVRAGWELPELSLKACLPSPPSDADGWLSTAGLVFPPPWQHLPLSTEIQQLAS